MKLLRVLLLIAALVPVSVTAQGPPGRAGTPAQRQAAEAQVFNRFMNRVSADMKLDAGGRARLEQLVRQTGQPRRQLAQRAVQIRRQLNQAARNESTSDADIDRLLTQFNQLRAEEEELWKRDQEALSRILNPRQRAIFILQWMRFNEQIRDLVQQRPGRQGDGG